MGDVATQQKEEAAEIGPLALSRSEQEVLTLYERLLELQLQIALVKAQDSYTLGATTQDITQAQDEVLVSRSSYIYSKDMVENVLIANPILRSVHDATNASPIEKNILPYVRRRDSASAAMANQSTELRALLDDTARVQAETLRAARANAGQAAELLRLAETARARRLGTGAGTSDEMARRLDRAKAELGESRQKWKAVKGTASAMVVGSGIDWAGDAALRDLVLDPDDDDD